MTQDSAAGAENIEEVRDAAGPAHPLGVMLGQALLRASRLSTRLASTERYRKRLDEAHAHWFEVEAEDGVKLAALRVPPAGDAEATAGKLPVVIVPGWLEVKELHAAPAISLARQGHDVVVMDLRAHGGSGGDVCTFSDLERDDLDRVIAHCRRRGWLGDRLVTMGTSTGAVTALMHAAGKGRTSAPAAEVCGVAAFAPFIDLEQAVVFFRKLSAPKMCQPWLLRGMREAALRNGFNLDDIDVQAVVADLELPVLFVASKESNWGSMAEQVKRLHDAKRHGWKRYEEVAEGNHFTLTAEAWPGVGEAIDAFFNEANRWSPLP